MDQKSTLGRIGRKAGRKAPLIIHQREICETRLLRSGDRGQNHKTLGQRGIMFGARKPLSLSFRRLLPLHRRPRTVVSAAHNTTTEHINEYWAGK